jgi:hypothetical protein
LATTFHFSYSRKELNNSNIKENFDFLLWSVKIGLDTLRYINFLINQGISYIKN